MTHSHYKHYSGEMMKRLDGFYGAVDARMNAQIEQWISGNRVLDVGCGFGQLVDYLRKKGYSCTGIDLLDSHISAGRERFPDADLRLSHGNLDFDDKSIDTIILKDTIHHILDESDVSQFFTELVRVCRKRVIIMDPNPTLILLAARKLIKHQDPVCSPGRARSILKEYGFSIVHQAFAEVIAFPLSGGFVGKQYIKKPNWYPAVLAFDDALRQFFRFFQLHSLLCWRYMLVGEFS